MDIIDCVVIGAGVVGLAVARAAVHAGWETVLLEAESAIGTGTSSRNSEVIHAGIYYPQDSLKARLCVAGRRALYAYCEAHAVPHLRCGKLIVATHESQRAALRELGARAAANGVTNLRWLEGREARESEPAVACAAALESPSTGIVDSHALMLSLCGEFEEAGGMLGLRAPVTGGAVLEGSSLGIMLRVGGDAPMELIAKRVVNSAGLQAHTVANSITGIPPATIPAIHFVKGNYFALGSGPAPFTHLIYPMPGPEPGWLGTHLTFDLAHRARFGPDIEPVDRIDYTIDPRRADRFYAAVRRYWPDLPDGALHADYAGIRPKLTTPGGTSADFVIQDARRHGITGLVNLYGIESPGLTSSLAIADEVMTRFQA